MKNRQKFPSKTTSPSNWRTRNNESRNLIDFDDTCQNSDSTETIQDINPIRNPVTPISLLDPNDENEKLLSFDPIEQNIDVTLNLSPVENDASTTIEDPARISEDSSQ